MDPTLLAVLVVAVLIAAVVVYFTVLKKPSTPELPEKDEKAAALEPKKPNELANKLAAKRDEQQKTTDERKSDDDKKAAEKAAQQKSEDEAKAREAEAQRQRDEAKRRDEEQARQKAATEEQARAEAARAAVPVEAPPAQPVVEAPVAAPVAAPVETPAADVRRAPPAAARKPDSKRNVAGVRKGLAMATAETGFFGRLSALVRRRELPEALVDELQEVLLTSDVGVKTTDKLLERVRLGLEKNELSDPTKVWDALRQEAKRILGVGGGGIVLSAKPTVVMMVGVNGAGKTTTIAKIATKLTGDRRSVVMAAGDTFRAAAVQQLETWGQRVGCPVIKGKEGADPAGVVFDAISEGKQSGADVVLCDTAGRLQTKTPLMDELKKIARSAAKALDGAPHETLLVIDATNGQNALAQARLFNEALPLTGIILTKLDGTAKGGVILQICDELGVPVRYIGLGERSEDLHEFDADEYVEAVFGELGKEAAA